MSITSIICSFFAALFVTSLFAAESPRERLSLDENWRFHLGDIPRDSFPGGEGVNLYGPDITYHGAKAGCAWGVSPLGPLKPQARNPIFLNTEGFITGTGHGCIVRGPEGRLWAFDTVLSSVVRVIWRDVGLDTPKGAEPGPFRYRVEAEASHDTWTTIVNRSQSTEDFLIEDRECAPTTAGRARLVVLGHPEGIQPGVAEYTVFGPVR